MTRLFGTSGIRGEAKTLFTPQFCFDIGRTFVKFLDNYKQTGPLAVGMDPRESSPRIKEAVFQGLAYSGRKLFDEGMVPIPAMNWILKKLPLAGSVMVTGSHVKEDFNGLKFFAFKEEILKEHEKEITKIYLSLKNKIAYEKKDIEVTKENKAEKLYEKMLFDIADKPLPKLRVIVDPGNGAQSFVMPRVLKKLNLEVIAINCHPIPDKFMARDTESGETYNELVKLIRKNKANLGIIYDADGDRAVFFDEKGRFIPADYTGSLISKYSDSPVVVSPISTSQVVEYIGKPVIRTKVGAPFVIEAMKKHNATFGFEASGGGISGEIILTRDGGSSTIKILNILKKENKSLKQLVDELPWFFIEKTKVDCPWKLNSLILKEAKQQFKGTRVEEIDGLKIWLDKESWILFRSSSNAPEFRVFAEAKSKQKAKKLVEKGINLVKNIIREKR